MRALLLMALLVTGCADKQHSEPRSEQSSFTWPMVQLDSPPNPGRYSSDEDKRSALGNYAADTSLYAFYVFHHARTVNDYAMRNGWRPPMFAPLCEGFNLPEVDPLPDKVSLNIDSDTPKKMAIDIANQLRQLLRQYRQERRELNKAYEKHRSTCLF